MKLKSEFVVAKVADEWMAVPVGDGAKSLHCTIRMNEVGASVFKALQQEVSLEELKEALYTQYVATQEEIDEAINSFIDELKKEELV